MGVGKTPKEAAIRLGCHVEHVYELIASGELPASDISLGTRPAWRIDSDDLEDFWRKRGDGSARSGQSGSEPNRPGPAGRS
jgi:excisionase family DNA binding protein